METNFNNIKNGIGAGLLIPEISANNQSHEIGNAICNKTVSTDVGGEFTISEHLPDIRKLIKVDVVPSVPVKFISGGGIQLNGGIDYIAVFLGTDGEIYSEAFPGEYSFNVPFDDISSKNERLASAAVYPDSAVSRVSGARRINIRCKLAAKTVVLGINNIDGGVSEPHEEHVQRLVKSTPYCTQLMDTRDDVELVDEIDLSEEGARYISSECRVFVENSESGDGYVDCRGYAMVKHFMCHSSGEPYLLTRKIPFSETVELDKICALSPACVSGVCTDISMGASSVDDIGEGKVNVTMRLCLQATAFNQSSIEYVKDVYSTRKSCTVDTEACRLPVLLACKNGNMTFDGCEELAKIGVVENGATVIDVSGSARCENVYFENNKYIINGKCRFGVVYYVQDISDVAWAECELPFRYEFEGKEGKISRCDCTVTAIDPRARCDGDKMQFDCELAVSCYVVGENDIELVSSVRMDGETKKRNCGFTVCYPDVGDSLWSVAKRYGAPVNETAKGNGIECISAPDEIRLPDGIKYMIV